MVGKKIAWGVLAVFIVLFLSLVPAANAQTGNSADVTGTVVDASGGAVANAVVKIHNPVSGYERTTQTDSAGAFKFANVPYNPYHLDVTAKNFDVYSQDVKVESSVPLTLKISLAVAGTSVKVEVESTGADLIENTSTSHVDVDRQLIDKLPLQSQSSSLSSLITLSTPGVAADSNGLFHGLGDHAENSFSIDGQPETDQVSKVFSNQLPVESIQSMEVIQGAPPAQYGGKTSVVIDVTTRSGMGVTTPHGDITTSYGSFGTATGGFDLSYGGTNWGNFISASGLNTGRFLDPSEFTVFHDKGNEENLFDRFDYKIGANDNLQVNLGFTRSWFQTPNSFDTQLQTCTVLSAECNGAGTTTINPITLTPLGPTDQRSQIRTFNVAPSWTHTVNPNTVVTLGAWVRHDQYNYYPSNDVFSDLGPIQDETVSQLRFLTNAGSRAVLTYVKGINNIQVGVTYEQTFLTENDQFGIVNPGLLSGSGCPGGNGTVTAAQCAILAPLDLTNGGQLFLFHGHTDVKELALYVQDAIKIKNWTFQVGIRGDIYNGLDVVSRQPEPRAGIAYNIKKTSTVLQVSYARTMESPFNENLILSGIGCSNPVVNAIMTVAQGFACPSNLTPLAPGFRNEFHAGIEQAFGKYLVISGEYIWKYTHNGYDFNVFGATPITLPIEWNNSKIPGFALRASVPNFHGFSAFVVMSHVSARFFPPTLAGIAPPQPPAVFRIDHDEAFNETTHLQYQPWKRGPWFGFNWRYDSGLVAGAVPCLAATATCSLSTSPANGGAPCVAVTATCVAQGGGFVSIIPSGDIAMVNNVNGAPLTADQEFQGGFFCGSAHATPFVSLPFVCPASQFGSTLISIPAPGTENDDHNPQRIAPRSLFDAAVGDDNLFHTDRYRWSARFTVINLANTVALYNYFSTFSGTHYVTPRTFTGELGFHF